MQRLLFAGVYTWPCGRRAAGDRIANRRAADATADLYPLLNAFGLGGFMMRPNIGHHCPDTGSADRSASTEPGDQPLVARLSNKAQDGAHLPALHVLQLPLLL